MNGSDDDFERLFRSSYAELVRFAARRGDLGRAEDVAAEAFTVAWRRREDLPTRPGDARAWIFGIARRLLLAQRRTTADTAALRIRLASEPAEHARGPEDGVLARSELAQAWERLTAIHQETLALTVLDGMTSTQAARVLDISPVAYRLRLMRARRSLAAHLSSQPAGAPAPAGEICTSEGA